MRSVIEEQVRANRPVDGRLSTTFWTKFNKDFKLNMSMADFMPPPDTTDVFRMSAELTKRLDILHSDNPVARKPTPIIEFLQVSPALPYSEFHLLVSAIQETLHHGTMSPSRL